MAEALPAIGPPPEAPAASRPQLDSIRVLPLSAELDEEALEWIRQLAVEEQIADGRAVVRQWDAGSDLYLLLEGRARVSLGGNKGRRARAGRLLR